MSDLIEENEKTSPLERTRNRLALTLFGVTLAAWAVLFVLSSPAKDFANNEGQFLEDISTWERVQHRYDDLTNNQNEYLNQLVLALLGSLCLPNPNDFQTEKGYFPFGKASEDAQKCRLGSMYWDVNPKVSYGIAQCLIAQPVVKVVVPKRNSLKSLLVCIENELGSSFVNYLNQNYSENGLTEILNSLDITQHWLAYNNIFVYPDKIKPRYPKYSTYTTYPVPHKGVNSWFKKQQLSGSDQAQQRLRKVSFSEAKEIIATSLTEAKKLRDSNTESTYVDKMQLGGLSLGFANLLKLALPAITLLSVICVVYVKKVEKPHLAESSVPSEWFPRGGEPADPIAHLPNGDEWLSRLLWLAFLSLPLVFSFLYVWNDFEWGAFSNKDKWYWNTSTSGFFEILFFALVWWCSISFTATNGQGKVVLKRISFALFLVTGIFCWVGRWLSVQPVKQIVELGNCTDIFSAYRSWQWDWDWEWIFVPAFWLIPLVWLMVSLRWRNASWFPYIAAGIMTLIAYFGFGEMLLNAWKRLL